jgi:hypothetical protein
VDFLDERPLAQFLQVVEYAQTPVESRPRGSADRIISLSEIVSLPTDVAENFESC